jgi:hypothetical protein
MAITMSVSTTANGNLVLVSFSVAEGHTDKRGSAQLFALNGTGTAANYVYLQDSALLNMPAGEEPEPEERGVEQPAAGAAAGIEGAVVGCDKLKDMPRVDTAATICMQAAATH